MFGKQSFGKLNQGVQLLEEALQALDPDTLDPRYAVDLVKVFSKAEKLAAAGKALAASPPRRGPRCPIPVAGARALMADSFIKVILTKAGKIQEVAHQGRTIPARLRTSLEQSYPECAVAGCRETKGLEIDHVIPLAEGGITTAANLVRICSHHHRLKTYRGFRLERVKGKWLLTPPQNAPARASPN